VTFDGLRLGHPLLERLATARRQRDEDHDRGGAREHEPPQVLTRPGQHDHRDRRDGDEHGQDDHAVHQQRVSGDVDPVHTPPPTR
jgi:hypothetical protein